MEFKVTSDAYPLLRVRLEPKEAVEAEVRAFVALTGQADIKSLALKPTKRNLKAAIGGKKSVVTSRFTATTDAELLLTSDVAGEILTLRSEADQTLRTGPGAYLASEQGVVLDVEVVKLTRASRMPLLNFRGEGRLFLGVSGTAHSMTLDDGESISLDRVHLLACDGTLAIEDVSEKGLWPTITGQDVIRLTGPGRVFIQSRPRDTRGSPLSSAVKALAGLI